MHATSHVDRGKEKIMCNMNPRLPHDNTTRILSSREYSKQPHAPLAQRPARFSHCLSCPASPLPSNPCLPFPPLSLGRGAFTNA